ncbi:Histone-lysine N-methyltransferase 2B [Bienertia sinuspersici]
MLVKSSALTVHGQEVEYELPELFHPIHPQHKLKLEYTEIPFNCNGCKEAGIGFKYNCHEENEYCDEFNLHKACALAPTTLNHPFYKKCVFQLHKFPPGPILRLCDACHNELQGLVYHCKRCGFDLHPCCVNLPQVLNDGKRDLYLHIKLSRSCHCCGRKGKGWAYVSECKMYNLHVSCVKKMLLESWEAEYLNVDNSRVRELETRIPTLKGSLARIDNHKSKGNLSKCCDIAGNAVNVIVSAILGDPTALIAGVVGGLISK